jgi:hypothetical protein
MAFLVGGVLPVEENTTIRELDFTGGQNVLYFKGEHTITLEETEVKGQGTIIVDGGNLFLAGDLRYADENASLGVIVFHSQYDEVFGEGHYPSWGNIFVQSQVHHMVGSYYADGSLISTNDIADPSISSEAAKEAAYDPEGEAVPYRSDQDIFGHQLVLEGTLFTRNTIGGSLGEGPEWRTPWGVTEDQITAQRYDLHFMRRYYPPRYQENTTGASGQFHLRGDLLEDADNFLCAKNMLHECDPNKHAFVIRVDGKAVNIPPPGFE